MVLAHISIVQECTSARRELEWWCRERLGVTQSLSPHQLGWLGFIGSSCLRDRWCRVARVARTTGDAELSAQVRGAQEILSMNYTTFWRLLTEIKEILLRQLQLFATRTVWAIAGPSARRNRGATNFSGLELRGLPRLSHFAKGPPSWESPHERGWMWQRCLLSRSGESACLRCVR